VKRTPKKGLFKGNSHDDGGIPSKVVETGQLLEIEGDEYYICRDAYYSDEEFEFKGKTNKQVLDKIYTEFSCKLIQSEMSAGDFIICKVVVKDKKKHNRKGTVKSILNEMQGEKSCKVETGNQRNRRQGGGIGYGKTIMFSPKQTEYLSDQIDIVLASHEYDNKGRMDKEEVEWVTADTRFPFLKLEIDENNLLNLQNKINNPKGSSYTKIEREYLSYRADLTLDSLHDDNLMAGAKRSLLSIQKKLVYVNGGGVSGASSFNDKFKKVLSEIEEGKRVSLNKYSSTRKVPLSSGESYYDIMTYPKQKDESNLSLGLRSKKYTDYNKYKAAIKRHLRSDTSNIDSFDKGGNVLGNYFTGELSFLNW
jgi:hypothetical protein